MNDPKLFFSFLLIIVWCKIASAQINIIDSSAQVITLWNLNETNTYEVGYQQVTILFEDTLSDVTITYDIDITVIDSTEKSFMVRWQNKNFNVTPFNAALKTLYDVVYMSPIEIKISRFGVYDEVLNWNEIKDSTNKALRKIRRKVKNDPEAFRHLRQIKTALSSPENLESLWIPDVYQFHMFHGAKYNLNKEIKGTILTPNIYNKSKSFDTHVIVVLEDINSEFDKYSLRSFLEIDTEQLTDATYNYLSNLRENSGQEMMDRNEFLDVTTAMETVSTFHDSGWLIDSMQWKVSVTDYTTNIENRRIRIK